jgi:hypothetical protein
MKSIITLRLKATAVFFPLLFFLFFNPLTHAKAEPPQKVHPIFSESFDSLDSIKANGGTYSDITLAKGKSGSGVLIQGRGKLVYPAANHFNFQKGTIEFWIKPNWDSRLDLGTPKYLLTIYEGTNFWTSPHTLSIPIAAYTANLNQRILNIFAPTFGYHGNKARFTQSKEPFTIMKWQPGEWHKVTLFWDFTLPDNAGGTHNSYLVAKIDDTYTTCQMVAPVGSDGFAPDAKIILGQDYAGRYPADAVIDELKIYDRSLLPVVPFPAYQFNPANPATVATFRKLFANDGVANDFETYQTQPADCPKLSDTIHPGQNVLFFQRPAFEQVYENYVPKEAEINNQFNYQAPPGEFETLFFNVYSRIDLNSVTVTYTDFQGVKGTIPKANLDLRVVKNWFQAARGPSTLADQLPCYVPELLLHNDQIPLDTDKTLSRFKIPSLPVLDHVRTRISQYTSRQFAMIVKVPKDAAAGAYVSTVTLKAAGFPDQKLKLNLEVLPFALVDTGKIYGLWYALDDERFYAKKMGLDIFKILKRDLIDIRNHGFNTIIFYSVNDAKDFWPISPLEVQTKKIAAAQQMGFKRAVIYTGTRPPTLLQDLTRRHQEMMTQHGFTPWFYGVDEMSFNHKLDEHIKKSMHIHLLGGKVVTTTTKATSDALDDPHNPIYRSFPAGTYEPLDWAIYPFFAKYATDLMAGKAKKNPQKIETYYWQCRDPNPQTNRYYCGYFPWITGLDGPCIHPYRASNNGQFYNDFDWTGPNRRFRPYTLAPPSVQGPVPTMQWEATREGIKDGKYLATWKYYKDKVAPTNPMLAHQSEQVINNILEHYKDKAPTYNPAAYRNSMAQYEADRKTVINEIMKLLNSTESEPKYFNTEDSKARNKR